MRNPRDLRGFNRYDHRNDPFAIFEYMGVTPSSYYLEFFLKECDELRKVPQFKLPSDRLENEKRAFLFLQSGKCYQGRYGWEFAA
jgi:hypothetical protein